MWEYLNIKKIGNFFMSNTRIKSMCFMCEVDECGNWIEKSIFFNCFFMNEEIGLTNLSRKMWPFHLSSSQIFFCIFCFCTCTFFFLHIYTQTDTADVRKQQIFHCSNFSHFSSFSQRVA